MPLHKHAPDCLLCAVANFIEKQVAPYRTALKKAQVLVQHSNSCDVDWNRAPPPYWTHCTCGLKEWRESTHNLLNKQHSNDMDSKDND